MILKEYLEELKDYDGDILLGSRTSYFYIGIPDADIIEALGNKMLKEAHEAIQINTSMINGSIDDLSRTMQKLPNIRERRATYRHVSDLGRRIKEAALKLSRAEEYVDTYIPILEREIKGKPFKRLSGDGIAIVVTGIENGKLWFKGDNDGYEDEEDE